tara:strand:- start:771 stop:1001 length:231 start_codon:yes stop_codon:yes gene_type:complete
MKMNNTTPKNIHTEIGAFTGYRCPNNPPQIKKPMIRQTIIATRKSYGMSFHSNSVPVDEFVELSIHRFMVLGTEQK